MNFHYPYSPGGKQVICHQNNNQNCKLPLTSLDINGRQVDGGRWWRDRDWNKVSVFIDNLMGRRGTRTDLMFSVCGKLHLVQLAEERQNHQNRLPNSRGALWVARTHSVADIGAPGPDIGDCVVMRNRLNRGVGAVCCLYSKPGWY